jgi:hypothetical protein
MRMRRQFRPIIDGLPYRIAPSSMVVAPHVALMATQAVSLVHASSTNHAPSSGSHGPTFSPDDTDMPETGTSTPIILAPPPGNGTVVC